MSLAANPDAELLVSGGDQVETANTESQWNAFLASDKLRQYPWAATIGNHDVGGKAYDQHFWTPNTDRSAPFYSGSPTTQSGGDYFYVYKDVLFIHLNSNAYASGKDAAHVGYITDVVNAHGAEAKYTVLVFHHAIYSPAAHANDGDNQQRRQDFPTAFSNLGVDLVLAGPRSQLLAQLRAQERPEGQRGRAARCRPGGPGPGRRHLRHRQLRVGLEVLRPDDPARGPDFGPDPLDPTGKRHYANSVENQEHVRTYVKVQVREDALVVENIRSGTCAAPNAAVELGNVSWCGPDSGATPAQPVGSVVDKVVIHAAEAPPVDAAVGGDGPRHALAHARHAGRVRRLHAGRREGLHGLDHGHGHLDRGRRGADRRDPSSTAPGRLVNGTFSLASAAAGRGLAAAVDGQDVRGSGHQ